jgi:hypothetical protein
MFMLAIPFTKRSSDRKGEREQFSKVSCGANVNISGHRLIFAIAEKQYFTRKCSGPKFLVVIGLPFHFRKDVQKNEFV